METFQYIEDLDKEFLERNFRLSYYFFKLTGRCLNPELAIAVLVTALFPISLAFALTGFTGLIRHLILMFLLLAFIYKSVCIYINHKRFMMSVYNQELALPNLEEFKRQERLSAVYNSVLALKITIYLGLFSLIFAGLGYLPRRTYLAFLFFYCSIRLWRIARYFEFTAPGIYRAMQSRMSK